jgi:hypothetical protein
VQPNFAPPIGEKHFMLSRPLQLAFSARVRGKRAISKLVILLQQDA